jgi:hypothetical protein
MLNKNILILSFLMIFSNKKMKAANYFKKAILGATFLTKKILPFQKQKIQPLFSNYENNHHIYQQPLKIARALDFNSINKLKNLPLSTDSIENDFEMIDFEKNIKIDDDDFEIILPKTEKEIELEMFYNRLKKKLFYQNFSHEEKEIFDTLSILEKRNLFFEINSNNNDYETNILLMRYIAFRYKNR